MAMATVRARMLVGERGLGAPPTAAQAFPNGWVAVALAAVFCLSLRATSTELLVASARIEGGRVLACRYFTGTRVAERQHAVGAREAEPQTCPLVRARHRD
jgi:hypothetical protein